MLPLFRLILSVTFAIAGVAKLRDRNGTSRTLSEFGVPKRLTPGLALVLPIVELATAAALVPVATARYGAFAALTLLILFIVGIGYNLALGRKPACNCFGQMSAQPIGPFTVLRNVLLAVCAVVLILKGGGIGMLDWTWVAVDGGSFTRVAILFGMVFMVGQTFLMLQMLRQQGRMLQRLEAIDKARTGEAPASVAAATTGLGVGAMAPGFSLPSMNGGMVTLSSLLVSGDRLLLLFMNPGCGPCLALAPEAAEWMRARPAGFNVFAISEGSAEENREKSEGLMPSNVLLQEGQEVADAYHAWGTPAAVVVGPEGVIASRVAQGADAIRALIAEFASVPPANIRSAVSPALEIGEPVPALELELLDGNRIRLDQHIARSTASAHLLLFWNPNCGFCERMLPDLRAWESSVSADAPRLLMISTGDYAANSALELRSAIAFDHGSAAATAFGAGGTPMAVLIDSDGRIASHVAGGADAFFQLAGQPA